MPLDLVWRPIAEDDLADIYRYIAADNPERAFSLVTDIRRRCGALKVQPELGAARFHIRPGLRILPLGRRIVVAYRIASDKVEILRVFSRGRDYETLMSDDETG